MFGAGVPLVTEITAASTFWCARVQLPGLHIPFCAMLTRQRRRRPAEMYHQDYYMKKSQRYKVYRYASGRDAYIESVWGASAHGEAASQQM